MTLTENKTGGYAVQAPEADSVDEINQLAGDADAARRFANRYIRDHIWNGKFRSKMCDKLEEVTGVKRKTKVDGKKADGTDKVVPDEGQTEYLKRVALEVGPRQDIADEVAASITLASCLEEAVREVKPTKIAASYLKAADDILAYSDEDRAKAIASLVKITGHPVAEDRDEIAKAVREWQLAEAKQRNLASELVA